METLILVRSDQKENAFGRYTGEILRAEGLNWYRVEEIGGQDAEYLASFKLVILTRCFLRQAEIQELLGYVEGGGRLISFRPCLRLAQALGLQATYKAQKGGYLRIEGDHPVGKGLCQQNIQFHGMAEHWRLPEGSAFSAAAWLGEDLLSLSDYPGLILGRRGGGRVAIFAYDLPATVAAIRQGDPGRVNTLSAGLDGIYRPSELFVGHLDGECALIPQADVHAALLSNVMDWLIGHPMPRLWYYPRPSQRSALIMTSDDDWSKIEEFEELMAAVEKRGGRITFYLVPGTHVTKDLAMRWAKRGHVLSVHPDFRSLLDSAQDHRRYGLDEQYLLLREMLSSSIRAHEEQFGLPVRTLRHHAVRWRGYAEAAHLLEELGVEMDFNYVSVSPFSATYMTGSGRPMKFADEDGRIIDVFQQSTLYSEDVILAPFVFSLKWPTERALAHVGQMLVDNVERYYTPIGLNSHPVSFVSYSRRFVEGLLDLANGHGVPILNAEEWLDFTLARYETEFLNIEWQAPTLRFTLRLHRQPPELTVMWPLGERRIDRVMVDECERDVTLERLWGRQFALLHLVEPGREHLLQVDFLP